MVALCLNGPGDPEKQSLGGLLKMPFVNGWGQPGMPPDDSADRPPRCLGDEVMFCDALNARQVAFEPAVGSVASSARPTSS